MFQRKGRFRPTDPPMPNVNIKKLVPRFDSLIILTCTSSKNGAQYMIEPPSPKILTSYVFKNDKQSFHSCFIMEDIRRGTEHIYFQ